jgi:hypothetical protein
VGLQPQRVLRASAGSDSKYAGTDRAARIFRADYLQGRAATSAAIVSTEVRPAGFYRSTPAPCGMTPATIIVGSW